VKEELSGAGLSENKISLIEKYLLINGTNSEKLEKIEAIVGNTASGKKGIEELQCMLDYLNNSLSQESKQTINIDFTLARGLNYYTGTIYEVKAKNVEMGSIGGGGRYDDLTGLFGVPDMPGVGISFGLDRIYDVMEELDLFPENINQTTEVLFFNLGEKESKHAFQLMQEMRLNHISCELFYENSKLDKQFKYASKKNIAFVVIVGSKEIEEKTCVVKDLTKGEQETIPENELLKYFNKLSLRF
jgi:histidyl-tRNA synthetase